MQSALDVLLPKIVPGVGTAIRSFDEKPDLLKRLPGLLRGYAHWPDEAGLGVVVVIDRDNEDCRQLLSRLNGFATGAGFEVVSVVAGRGGTLANRLAAEELEAWWFGDLAAVRAAYPGVTARGQAFREPDAIRGGTWEALERALQAAGHHRGGLRKVAAAEDIAPHIDIEANRSPSFAKFRDGVRLLVVVSESSSGPSRPEHAHRYVANARRATARLRAGALRCTHPDHEDPRRTSGHDH